VSVRWGLPDRSVPLALSENCSVIKSPIHVINTNATYCRPPEISICEWKCVDPIDKSYNRLVVDTSDECQTWLFVDPIKHPLVVDTLRWDYTG